MMKKFTFLISLVVMMFILTYSQIARADFGMNPWSATFYNDMILSTPCASNCTFSNVAAINFNWGAGIPIVNGVAVGVGTDHFSARFTSVQSFAAGTYQFVVASDDGIRVYIDGQMVLDRFIGRTLTTDQFSHHLAAGLHSIAVEYFENIDNAIVQVQWFPNQPGNNYTAAPVRDYYNSLSVPLSWTLVSWASGYEIEVSKTKAFAAADLVDHQDALSADTLTWTTVVPQIGLYYWRVRAKNLLGLGATWSSIQSFTA
jgi:hypothetical protein